MAIITESIRRQLEEWFGQGLREPVRLRLFVEPSPKRLLLPLGTASSSLR